MKTWYKDGTITFETNHFSTYVVEYRLSTLTIVLIIGAIALVLCLIGYIVITKLNLKGKYAYSEAGNYNTETTNVEQTSLDSNETAEGDTLATGDYDGDILPADYYDEKFATDDYDEDEIATDDYDEDEFATDDYEKDETQSTQNDDSI